MSEQLRLLIRNQGQLSELVLLQSLRILKGKRVVFLALWDNQKVLVKLFAHKRHWVREIRGLDYLIKQSIRCPDKLFAGAAEAAFNLDSYSIDVDVKVHILVTQYFEHAVSFRTLWRSELPEQVRRLQFADLLRTIAQHHQAGIVQNDLHLGNFLVVQNSIVSIDGDAIDYQPKLALRKCYEQLGILLVQSFPRFDDLLESLLFEYFKARNLEADTATYENIISYRDKHRLIASQKWLNKCYRNSTQTKALVTSRKKIYIVQEFVSSELLLKLSAFTTNNPGHESQWADDKHRYVATRYTHNVVSKRRRWLKENQASIDWQYAQNEVFIGEAKRSPVALVLLTLGPWHRVGYFVHTN